MLKHSVRLLQLTFDAWLADRAPRLGASLAFYSILSIGPLLLLLMQVAGALLGEAAAEAQITGQIKGLVGAQGMDAIRSILTAAAHRQQTGLFAKLFAFGVLLFGASGVFNELQDALNIIWKVPPRPGRPVLVYLKEKLFAFLMVTCAGVLLFASLAVSTLINTFIDFAQSFAQNYVALDIGAYLHRLDVLISFLMSTLLFALIFKVVPDRVIRWSHIWPGAILTAVLFVLGKFMIGFYLSQSGVASVFGAAGSVVILLVWVYYTAQIIFFGAEFTHVVDEHGLRPAA